MFMIVASVTIITALIFHSEKEAADRSAWDNSTEGYLLQHASTKLVYDGYRPVLIYRYREGIRSAFTAVGTCFTSTNGPIIATVEHLLQPKFSNELFVLRFLSPDEHTATNGIVSIAYRNVDAGLPSDQDVVFLRFQNTEARRIPCFTSLREEESTQTKAYLFDEPVEIGGRHVRHIRSLVTGIEYPTAGIVLSPQGVLIKFRSKPGHSGTGFVDEYGQLYILSRSPNAAADISLLMGPFANLGKRL